MKLYFCATLGEKDERPIGAQLYRTPYHAAKRFLEDHPDFKPIEGSYMGKVVFEGQATDKLYSFTHGSVEVEGPVDHLGEEGDVNISFYRNLSYDDFVSGLPVMSVRHDK
ncbi:hypothetical protein pEaSNUABM11_00033 [Erwinia phage pEa_SNUABM_11]|nr:hypothetical protein pEaSNUABM11_00033 [Erwinia phage pEa_SNUABM_11]